MGDISEFNLKHRVFLQTYRWRRIDPVPWTPLKKPLSECRLAIGSSAGLVLPGQEKFDDDMKGGDYTFRTIPSDVDVSQFIDCHRSDAFDHTAMMRDPNLAFPIDRVRELAERGRIGSVAPRHLSFMGSVTAPSRMIKETIPEAAQWMVDDQVDVALFVPV